MAEINVTVAGVEFWQQELDGIHSDILRNINTNMLRTAHIIGAEFLVYPPPPPSSKYVRTGRLADSVKVVDQMNGYTVSIDPVDPKYGVHYGRYVIGDGDGQGQAWMHVGRWQLLKTVADEKTAVMFDDVSSQLQSDISDRGIG